MYVGGLVGDNPGTIINSEVFGSLTVRGRIGGNGGNGGIGGNGSAGMSGHQGGV